MNKSELMSKSRQALALSRFSRTVLEVSTAHIPRDTAKNLDNSNPDVEPNENGDEPLWQNVSYTNWNGYGWIFYVGEDQVNAARTLGHEDLAVLLQIALDHDFDWLKLDGAGDHLPESFGAKTYEW